MKVLHIRKICFITIIIFMCVNAYSQEFIKKPNVSGQFYPADPKKLSFLLDNFLDEANTEPFDEKIEVIVSPHAGYIYSGPVAGYGYKAASRQHYSTIIILAPSHFVGFRGISVWPKGKFETPLGSIDVDQVFTQKIIDAQENASFMPQAFAREHSLEVQIPFLQEVFKEFKIVPIIFGQLSYEECERLAMTLNQLVGKNNDVLIVASTDMSHYHDSKTAKEMDHKVIELVKTFKAKALWQNCHDGALELCGFGPTTTAIIYAKQRSLSFSVLNYADSGDITGDKKAVVGYFSAVFYKEEKDKNSKDRTMFLSEEQKKRLLEIAKQTINEYVKNEKTLEFSEKDSRLLEEEGAFVTIHKSGKLRGCIGNILGRGPLYETVRDMAVASSTQDPRFPRVQEKELKDLEIEISVLSKPWRVNSVDEIEVGTHGVIVSKGLFNKGLFLPQVATEQRWNRDQFLSNLCAHKAGLPPDAWKDPSVTLEAFTAQVFSEKDF